MEKAFNQHCPQCGRYMKIEGHHFKGNEYIGMHYDGSDYFCGVCRVHVPVIAQELAFLVLENDGSQREN